MARRYLAAALIATAALQLSARASAETMAVAADRQVMLLLKILTYDRQLESKAGSELVIGVVSVPTDPDSARATEAIQNTLFGYLKKTVKKLTLQYYLHDYTTPEKFQAWVKSKNIKVLYISPGNSKNLAAILKVSEQLKITSTTGVPDYVERGVAIGIGERQQRPQILINLPATKREGSEFDASLLRIATIVK
jgi:hypothetical protein